MELFFHWIHKRATIIHLELAKFQQVFEEVDIDGHLMLFQWNILDKNLTAFLPFQDMLSLGCIPTSFYPLMVNNSFLDGEQASSSLVLQQFLKENVLKYSNVRIEISVGEAVPTNRALKDSHMGVWGRHSEGAVFFPKNTLHSLHLNA